MAERIGLTDGLVDGQMKKNARDYPLTENTENLGDTLGWVAKQMTERIGLKDGCEDGYMS